MCVDWGVSIRKACGAICFDTSSYHYKSRRTDQAAVESRIKEIAETRVRYGYRRVHVLLRREGWMINHCPAGAPRFGYRGEDVVQTLERVCGRIGYRRTIRVDNGSEFISRDLDLWAYANDVTLDFSRPGKPTDNGFIEAFNSKLRAECLNAHWFTGLADAREKLEDWRRHYNENRPHSAIGYKVPIAMHYPDGVTSPSS